MPWTNRLYETYDNLYGKADNVEPVSHQYIKTQIEITLYNDGRFAGASLVDKEDEKVICPVTEKSAGRSSGIAPHALADTLAYVAKDFSLHVDKAKDKKVAQDKHSEYMRSLKKWETSDFSHPKVHAICSYLEQGNVISDLAETGIITLGDNGEFLQDKIAGNPLDKVVVRFRVLNSGEFSETWRDQELIDNYSAYYAASQDGKKSLCYLSGENDFITENTPKNIVGFFGNAKLISANDNTNYTYRGRFTRPEEAVEVGYTASQKIHLALRWLCSNEGVLKNGRMYLVWNPEHKAVPDIFGFIDEDISESSYREKLANTLKGYAGKFSDTDSIIIMALDAATTGRLSIVYYNELMAPDFFARLEYWFDSTMWELYGKQKNFTFYDIVRLAFGAERGAMISIDDKIAKMHTDRLLKCMLDRQIFPYDIVHSLLEKASRPSAYSPQNYSRVLSCACAMIKKYHIDRNMADEKEIEMILDKENTDRSYLFGRLLAVFEQAEKLTYERGSERETNASRLMAAYVNHPMQTWKQLEIKTRPYFNRLSKGSNAYLRKLIEEITSQFKQEDIHLLNTKLNENYLIGYYLQRQDFYNKNTDTQEEN